MKKIYAVYNGSFNYLEDIKISPLSRAYTFSDSVYEVIPFFNWNSICKDQWKTAIEYYMLLRHWKSISDSISYQKGKKEAQ